MTSYIYVLLCEDNIYYIGESKNPTIRISNHFKGNGSEITKKFKPVFTISIKESNNKYDELTTTLDYMNKYGIDKVYGSVFCKLNLNYYEKNLISSLIKSINNTCYKCGAEGHYASDNVCDIADSSQSSIQTPPQTPQSSVQNRPQAPQNRPQIPENSVQNRPQVPENSVLYVDPLTNIVGTALNIIANGAISVSEMLTNNVPQVSNVPQNPPQVLNPPQISNVQNVHSDIDKKILNLIKDYFGQIIIYIIKLDTPEYFKYHFVYPSSTNVNRTSVIKPHEFKIEKFILVPNKINLPSRYVYLHEKSNFIVGLGFLENIKLSFKDIHYIKEEIVNIIQ